MAKVIVEFEVNTSHVGRGYFENRLATEMETKDNHGNQQIKTITITAPFGWR